MRKAYLEIGGIGVLVPGAAILLLPLITHSKPPSVTNIMAAALPAVTGVLGLRKKH